MKYQESSLVLHVRHRLLVHGFGRPQFGHFMILGRSLVSHTNMS